MSNREEAAGKMTSIENPKTSKEAVAKRLHTSNSMKLAQSRHNGINKDSSKKLEAKYNNSTEPANSEYTNNSERSEDTAKESISPSSGVTTTKLMRTLATKKREFFQMRKRLLTQQDALISLFATLKELESRIGADSEDQLGELRVLSVTQWPAHDLLLLIRENLAVPTDSDLTSLLGFQILERQREELNSITGEVTVIVKELISTRAALVNFMRDKYKAERTTFSKNQEWKHKNLEIDNETELIQKRVADVIANVEKKVSRIMDYSKIPWIDREAMVKKQERTQREILALQNRLEGNSKEIENGSHDHIQPSTPVNHRRVACDELTREQSAHKALQEKFNGVENALRGTRVRIAALERQLKELRAERDVFQQKHHALEEFCRQRNLMNEAESKNTMNASKREEIIIENLMRERNELASRLEELQKYVQASESRAQGRLEEQRARCDELQAKLAAKDSAAEARIHELQMRVKELEENLDSLRSRSAQLLEIESEAVNFIPLKEAEPNEREIEMWKELQGLQKALKNAENVAQQYHDDKENLVRSLTEIAWNKCDNTAEGKMAAVLLEKEQKIMQLYNTIEEQKEREKVMQNTIARQEQQIMEMRLEVNCLRNYNNCDKDMPFQDLQTEVIELQTRLMSLSRERDTLLSTAASRALMLERHERAAERFVRVTRLRRDLAGLVAPSYIRRTPRPRRLDDKAREHVSHSLTELCKSAAEQWSALHNAYTRMEALEKTVMAQKEQLERESRVRTLLERHRETLERDLLKAKKLSRSHMHIPALTGLTRQMQLPLKFIQEFIGTKKRVE